MEFCTRFCVFTLHLMTIYFMLNLKLSSGVLPALNLTCGSFPACFLSKKSSVMSVTRQSILAFLIEFLHVV